MKEYIHLLSKNNKKSILFFIVLNLVLVFAETFSVTLIPLFIDYIVNPTPLLSKYFNFFESFDTEQNIDLIINYGIIFFILVFISKNIFFLSVIYYETFLSKKFNIFLKKKFLNLYVNSPFEIIKKYNSSEILRNTDTETQNYVTNFFLILKFSKDILLFMSIFLLLIFTNFISTIVIFLFLVGCILIYFFSFHKILRKVGIERLESVNSVYKWINQIVGSIKEIKITKKESIILEKFSEKVRVFEESKRISSIIQAIPMAIFELIFVILIMIILKLIVDAEMNNSLPIVSLYVIAFIRLLPIFSRLGSNLSNLKASHASVKLLNDELNKLIEYKKHNDNRNDLDNNNFIFNDRVVFKNLSFKYKDGKNKIFDKFNYEIKKNKIIAFVGKSGSGKTTLINLLSGLLNTSKNSIIIDGKDINENLNAWHNNIGLISQDIYILDDTILNNITFLENESAVDKTKLDDAIFYSGLKETLNNLEHGIKTRVGEKGSDFSGGQNQRIALARLLYRNPSVLILDEFTSALDPITEDEIIKNLKFLNRDKGKTIIIISHKIKPLKICDEIIILDNGKIVEKMDYENFYQKFNAIYD